MIYFAICAFDVKNASYEDYENAYADLARIGLKTSVTSDQGTSIRLPTTLTAGTFEATGAGALRDQLCDRVQKAFTARNFSSEIFILAGGDWAWGHRTT